MTLFHELYGAYYTAVSKILSCAVEGTLTDETLHQIVKENSFQESGLAILPALRNEKWQLMGQNLNTPLQHKPTMPLTDLEKRWLKAICLDPRCRLFTTGPEGLEDVVPLFTPEDYCLFDQYGDGDPYGDAGYIARFQTIRKAIHSGQPLKLRYVNRRGDVCQTSVMPVRLEYSEKDDKFRLLTSGCRFLSVVNLARIQACEMLPDWQCRNTEEEKPKKARLTFELVDERNALERVMLHFSHYEKLAEQCSDRLYRVTVYYDQPDETEMVIRVLSFGPLIKVTEPQPFVNLIKDRLTMQKSCGLK